MVANLYSKIYFAGHHGMVGSAIVRNLKAKGFTNIVTRTHAEMDLTSQAEVKEFFETEKPRSSLFGGRKSRRYLC